MKKWYQSKLIWTGVIAVLTAVLAALSTVWDLKLAAIAGLGALVVVLRKYSDTGIIALLFIATLTFTACGASLGQIANGGLDALAKCGLKCGVEIAEDALSCPVNRETYQNLIDREVQKGMASDVAMCMTGCLLNEGIDALTDQACK
jgi:hypothetical protein